LIAGDLRQLWESFESIGYDAFVRAFITHLHRIDKEFVLVLDDYHIIENEKIDTFIKLLIEYLPLKIKLVIITREDLPELVDSEGIVRVARGAVVTPLVMDIIRDAGWRLEEV